MKVGMVAPKWVWSTIVPILILENGQSGGGGGVPLTSIMLPIL